MFNNRKTKVVRYTWESPYTKENMEKSEKIVSVGAGAFIFLKGITNIISSPTLAIAELAVGGGLIYRGLSGYCPVKEILDKKEDRAMLVREKFIADNSTPLGI